MNFAFSSALLGSMLVSCIAKTDSTREILGFQTAEKPLFELEELSPLTGNVDSLFAVKHLRLLYVFRNDSLLKSYRFVLGDSPVGPKHFRYDEKTPEGLYHIDGKNPNSICHKNLGISYPNSKDVAYAKKHNLPAGGDVKIHGLPNGQGYIGKAHLLHDWTNGCIGVTDEEMDELYEHVQIGSPIYIAP